MVDNCEGCPVDRNRCNELLECIDPRQEVKPRPKRKIKAEVFFRWYDLWIGAYIDIKNKTVYIIPIPTIGIKISLIMV